MYRGRKHEEGSRFPVTCHRRIGHSVPFPHSSKGTSEGRELNLLFPSLAPLREYRCKPTIISLFR